VQTRNALKHQTALSHGLSQSAAGLTPADQKAGDQRSVVAPVAALQMAGVACPSIC
jgi:hypothetical protein